MPIIINNHFKKVEDFDGSLVLFKSFSLMTEDLIKAAFFFSRSFLTEAVSF